jgi:hypothetical protein
MAYFLGGVRSLQPFTHSSRSLDDQWRSTILVGSHSPSLRLGSRGCRLAVREVAGGMYANALPRTCLAIGDGSCLETSVLCGAGETGATIVRYPLCETPP